MLVDRARAILRRLPNLERHWRPENYSGESFLLVADRKANFKANAQMALKFMDWAVRDLRPPEIVRACSYGGTRPSVGAV